MDQDFPSCYTPKSSLAPLLIDAYEQYALDNPMRSITFLGDFNCHNPDWLTSRSPLNKGGERVEEFCEMFGFSQMIDFPTRQGNTLDLVMTRCAGLGQERPGLGTSDHVSIELELETEKLVPITLVRKPTLMWEHAPWQHIRGALRREVNHWDPRVYKDDDDAEMALDRIFQKIIKKYVKFSKPKKPGPVIWWNADCPHAYDRKVKVFAKRAQSPINYNPEVNRCRTVQKRAFAKYNHELSGQLEKWRKLISNSGGSLKSSVV